MVVLSILYAAVTGRVQQILPSMLAGCQNGVTLTIEMAAGYMLFCGLMEIARESGVSSMLEKMIRPALQWLMPSMRGEGVRQTVTMNLSMNILGMGNAATPMGMEAVRQLDEQAQKDAAVRHDLYMLLILNATSIQLMPTTVLTLRAAAGSADVNAVLIPTLLCTAASTAIGVGAGMMCRKWGRKNHE